MKAVLGIIGMILLIIFLIILAVIVLVLFCPIKYQAKGDFGEGQNSVKGKLWWISGIFKITFDWQEDVEIYAKILFLKKKLYPDVEEGEDLQEIKDIEQPAEEEDGPSSHNETDQFEEYTHERTNTHETSTDKPLMEDSVTEDLTTECSSVKESSDKDLSDKDLEVQDGKTDKDKSVKGIYGKIKKFFLDLKKKSSDISEKVSGISDKYSEISNNPYNRAAISHIKNEIVNILKIIMPGKLKINLCFSTGSPDTTGIMLGVFAMFPIGYKNRWNIQPDFEADEFYIKGNMDIKGYIFLYQFLAVAIRILFDKNCRRLYNNLKN